MSYKLTFGDGDAEAFFWEKMKGYQIQLRQPDGTERDVEILGYSWDSDGEQPELLVSDPIDQAPREDSYRIPLTGDEEVHVY